MNPTIIWAAAAAALLITEMLTGTIVLLFAGLGALAAGLCSAFGLSTAAQYGALSAGLLGSAWAITRKHQDDTPDGFGAHRFHGQTGTVQDGRMKIDGDTWAVSDADGNPVPDGTTVVVTDVSGTRMIVEPNG